MLRSTVDGHFHPGKGSVSNGRPFSAALERVVPSRPWERDFISYLNTLLSAFRRRLLQMLLGHVVVMIPFKRRVKTHLPSPGIFRSSPDFPR
jgi:hypothetical protein